MYNFIDFENYYGDYADIEQIANQISIELGKYKRRLDTF